MDQRNDPILVSMSAVVGTDCAIQHIPQRDFPLVNGLARPAASLNYSIKEDEAFLDRRFQPTYVLESDASLVEIG
jgi:hypothetical protein